MPARNSRSSSADQIVISLDPPRRTFGGSARSATLRVTVPLRMRVGERLADDAVDDPHGLRREPAALAVAATVDEQLRVERVEVLGLQLLQRDVSDAWVDVGLDVVAVRGEGRRSQLRLLGRQPPLEEVVAERDPLGRPVVAVVHALDEIAEHLLGALARRAGRIPAVTLLAGRRVDAFVDDGVVAVAACGRDVPS